MIPLGAKWGPEPKNGGLSVDALLEGWHQDLL